MVILGGRVFLMNEVPLQTLNPEPATVEFMAGAGRGKHAGRCVSLHLTFHASPRVTIHAPSSVNLRPLV